MTQPRHSYAFNWTVAAIIVGGLIMGALLFWQLHGLTPSRWCGVALGAAKLAGEMHLVDGCRDIILRLLDLKDHAIIGLLGVVGLSFLVMVVMTFKARITFSGPGGVGGSVGSAADGAQEVATAATDKAQEIVEAEVKS
jgi:hypothetical protein